MDSKQQIYQTLGLAFKSQKLVWGFKLFNQIKTGQLKIVIVATDMGASQKKKIINQCAYYQIEVWADLFTSAQISAACGQKKLVAVGIGDVNISNLIKKYHK